MTRVPCAIGHNDGHARACIEHHDEHERAHDDHEPGSGHVDDAAAHDHDARSDHHDHSSLDHDHPSGHDHHPGVPSELDDIVVDDGPTSDHDHRHPFDGDDHHDAGGGGRQQRGQRQPCLPGSECRRTAGGGRADDGALVPLPAALTSGRVAGRPGGRLLQQSREAPVRERLAAGLARGAVLERAIGKRH